MKWWIKKTLFCSFCLGVVLLMTKFAVITAASRPWADSGCFGWVGAIFLILGIIGLIAGKEDWENSKDESH
jgi:hypothetical protein